MLIVSALLSIGAVLFAARGITLLGPARVIPSFFLASAALLVGEWALAMRSPRPASVFVYLHVADHRFDPDLRVLVDHQRIVRPAGGAAEHRRASSAARPWAGSSAVCLADADRFAARAFCGCCPSSRDSTSCARSCCSSSDRTAAPKRTRGARVFSPRRREQSAESGFRVLRRVAYLRNLALIVLLGNVAATLIDYLFKARAAEKFATSAELVHFFAVFYTVVSVVTLVVQAGMTRRLLERVGIANLVAVRPAVMTVGGLASLPVLGLVGLGILRGVEGVLQSSLFRSGYELLFTPVVPNDKRTTKTIIDVGADRMGEVVGGAVIRAVIFLPVAIADHLLVLIAVGISVVGFIIARALRRGYIRALEASLINRANVLDIKQDEGPGTHTMLMESFTGIDLTMSDEGIRLDELRSAARAAQKKAPDADADADEETTTAPLQPVSDPEIATLIALRSGKSEAHPRGVAAVARADSGHRGASDLAVGVGRGDGLGVALAGQVGAVDHRPARRSPARHQRGLRDSSPHPAHSRDVRDTALLRRPDGGPRRQALRGSLPIGHARSRAFTSSSRRWRRARTACTRRC